MTRIVMTGASGFVGKALCHQLLARGIEVIPVVRALSFSPEQTAVASLPDGDVLIHLGEISDRKAANELGHAYEQAAMARLHALLARGYAHIVYASSAVLYGDRASAPCREDAPVFATDVYTRIKHASERMVLTQGGVVARLSNLYGPGMARGNVLGTILGQLGQDGPIKVQTTTPVRDFLWIDDAASALSRCVESKGGGVFNVGSGRGVSVEALARIVLAEAGEQGRSVVAIQSDAGPSSLVLDISEIKAKIGWAPACSLQEGIRRLVHSSKEVQ